MRYAGVKKGAGRYWLGLVVAEWGCAVLHVHAFVRRAAVAAGLQSPEEPVIAAAEPDLPADLDLAEEPVAVVDPAAVAAADPVGRIEAAAGTGRSEGCMAAGEERTRESSGLEEEAGRMRRTTAVEAGLGCARRYEQAQRPEFAPRLV